ncbi:MAG: L-histidine N(alpha)-methyltransferase [Candidatus Competibacteraceae bacterium]
MNTATVQFYDYHPGAASLYAEVLAGLTARPKAIPPKFFYDTLGSQLFDAICELPEYYPTRVEIDILQQQAGTIAALVGSECLLIELGSGASRKVRLLLDHLRPRHYLGVDISREFLLQSTRQLAIDYPWLDVHAACADFSQKLDLSYCPPSVEKLAFFPGSSIGNFHPHEAVHFLKQLAANLQPHGALLIGVDLKKDPRLLHAAYNDARGVTAEFNLNLLRRCRLELDTDLDPSHFAHQAFYNESQGRIEMHLLSRERQKIRIEDRVIEFEAGETIHTENSYKYDIEEFQTLARQAGYRPEYVWTDARQLFSVHYLHVEKRH